jgi:hypothetical protein
MFNQSIDHLKKNNMSYYRHFIFATTHGIKCIKAGIFLISHAIIPAFFAKTGSNLVNNLNKSFIDHNEYLK